MLSQQVCFQKVNEVKLNIKLTKKFVWVLGNFDVKRQHKPSYENIQKLSAQNGLKALTEPIYPPTAKSRVFYPAERLIFFSQLRKPFLLSKKTRDLAGPQQKKQR